MAGFSSSRTFIATRCATGSWMKMPPTAITNCWNYSQISGFFDMRILLRDPTGGSNFLRIVLYDLKRRTEARSVPGATGKVLPSPGDGTMGSDDARVYGFGLDSCGK